MSSATADARRRLGAYLRVGRLLRLCQDGGLWDALARARCQRVWLPSNGWLTRGLSDGDCGLLLLLLLLLLRGCL